jgi:hypothetical protein
MGEMQEQALATLIAKDEIRDLVAAYCRAIDRKDFDMLETLYHPSAGDEHGCNPTGTAEEFFTVLRAISGPAITLHHNITNHHIKVDGDRAEGEAYLLGYHVIEGDDGARYAFLLGGRYLDRYARRDGVWKFTHRRVAADWVKHFDAEQVGDAIEVAGMTHGESSGDDTSYQFFDLFRRGRR